MVTIGHVNGKVLFANLEKVGVRKFFFVGIKGSAITKKIENTGLEVEKIGPRQLTWKKLKYAYCNSKLC